MFLFQVLEQASRRIGDPDGDRYERRDLLAGLNGAIEIIHWFKPELFETTDIIRLEPGNVQRYDVYSYIKTLLGQTNALGELIYGGLVKVDRYALSLWNEAGRSSTPYRIKDYSIETQRTCEFYVYPSVPKDGNYYVRAQGIRKRPEYTDKTNPQLDNRISVAALMEFIAYWCYSADTESKQLQSQASAGLRQFLSLMNIQTRHDTVNVLGNTHNPEIREIINTIKNGLSS